MKTSLKSLVHGQTDAPGRLQLRTLRLHRQRRRGGDIGKHRPEPIPARSQPTSNQRSPERFA